MRTQRITCVLGSAAEYVRLAPVASTLRRRLPHVRQVLVGADEDDLRSPLQLFEHELDVPELSYVLDLGPAGTPGRLAYTLDRLERVIELERPDLALVAGDAETALAAMLAAVTQAVPIAHLDVLGVEGTNSAFLTRRIAAEVADLHFAPSEEAKDRMLAQGVAAERIHLVGSTMIDALVGLEDRLNRTDAVDRHGLPDGQYVLVVLRGSVLGNRQTLWELLDRLRVLSRELPVALVMHAELQRLIRSYPLCSTVRKVGPLDYADSLALIAHAAAVLTDCGEVQDQATYFRVRCVTLSDLIPLDESLLVAAQAPARRPALWDGQASERIVDVLQRAFESRAEPAAANDSPDPDRAMSDRPGR
jgi:UDP-N-acetylglucosamine 2-epimerase (non-hydrolysing)